jgi:hypothetical protein
VDKDKPNRSKMRSYTVTALLGLFIVAVILAIVSRVLPGSLSRLANRALRRER